MNKKQNVIYPYNRMLSDHEEEWNITDSGYDMDEPWKYAKWKRPDTKTTYYMIPFIWNNQNNQIYRDRK